MPPVGFEPTISAGERPQIYALDRAATGTGSLETCTILIRGLSGKYQSILNISRTVRVALMYKVVQI